MRQTKLIILLMAVAPFLHTNTVIANAPINRYYNDSPNPNNPAFNNIRFANQTMPNPVAAVPQNRFPSGRGVREDARAVPGAQLGTARIAGALEIALRRQRAASPAQANRPPAQLAQQQPAQQVKQTPAERPEPASRSRGAKDKPDKNDKKN